MFIEVACTASSDRLFHNLMVAGKKTEFIWIDPCKGDIHRKGGPAAGRISTAKKLTRR